MYVCMYYVLCTKNVVYKPRKARQNLKTEIEAEVEAEAEAETEGEVEA